VEVQTGARPLIAPNAQGPGNDGEFAGTFTIRNQGQQGAELRAIELTASGSGDDSADYSNVAIWFDEDDDGQFDPANDTLIDSHTAFPTDDGTLTFDIDSAEWDFPVNTTRRYFIVVKMSGSGAPAATFDFIVSDITTGGGADKSGVPSPTILGVRIEAAALKVTPVTTAPQLVFANEPGAGGHGVAAAEFTIASNHLSGATLNSIEIAALGTANAQSDVSEVALYREDNNTPGFQGGSSGGDELVDSHTGFPSPNGSLVFTFSGSTEQDFATNESRLYYLVLKLNGNALPTTTFDFQVTDLTVTNTLIEDVPSAVMPGLVIRTPEFVVTDTTPFVTPQQVPLGRQGYVMQSFSITYPGGPDNTVGTVQVRGGGTGNEVADIASVQLWLDTNGDLQLDGADVQLGSGTYALDNGQVNLQISGQPAFTANETRHYLIVYNFNLNAADGATFFTYVHNLAGVNAGTDIVGVPAPDANGTPGIIINANILQADVHGPATALPVDSDSVGPHGDGELLLDFSLVAAIQDWTVTDLTFEAAGSADHASAFSELALYQDNGTGTWDGSAVDALAAATLSGFDSVGRATFTLVNSGVVTGTARRFFLVGTLAGNATEGQTLGARLLDATATSGTQGMLAGIPSAASTALVIDVAVMSATLAPNAPAAAIIKAGAAFTRPLGKFLFTAVNNEYVVNSITFTTGGNADWAADLDPASGVQVYRDDGSGSFDPATDQLLFEGPGAVTVLAAFTSPLVVPNAGEVSLWFVVRGTAATGAGTTNAPLSFSVRIAVAGDIGTTGTRVLGMPLPDSATLGVIDFAVTSFSPLIDAPAGGAAITMDGHGFLTPLTIRIGGALCPGTAVVVAGTRVTGLQVPAAAAGSGIPIEVASNLLEPQTLTQTFTYGFRSKTPSGGGCAVGGGAGLAAGLGLLGLLALGRRRRDGPRGDA
jgi:hypothetical protein